MKSTILFAFIILLFGACSEPVDLEKLEKLEAYKKEAEAYKMKMESASLMHTVYIWLKEDLPIAEEKAFLKGCESLGTIKSVNRMRMGGPALTEDREVVDQSYSYALNLEFVDIAAQDAYQIDPIHLKFVEDHKDKWTKVIVYDNKM